LNKAGPASAHTISELTLPSDVPVSIGRTVYRIVQEALTNVHKHVRDAATEMLVHGAAGEGVTVRVTNIRPVAAGSLLPGAGAGLAGLRERVDLSEGTLTVGLTPAGGSRLDGLAATRELQALPDPPEVVVLTTFDLDDYVFRALQAGASGLLLKDTPPRELVQAVRVTAAGDAMLSPAVTRRLIGHFAADPRTDRQRVARKRLTTLTDREREVLTVVARGRSNADDPRPLCGATRPVGAGRQGNRSRAA
jgi:CheY-like chemotaxis protein